jgi:hypothetical protein
MESRIITAKSQVFLDEHSVFDKGVHDDIVDTTTQALNYFRGSGPPGISLLYEEWAAEREQPQPKCLAETKQVTR